VFGLRVRRVPAAERRVRLARVAELLGLGALLERRPSQLSGGQQQRVALGRALISETPVCLMDEPLSNLDAQLRLDMRREIRAIQQRLGVTMVYVTHDQTEAMTMADQVILLRAGRVEQDAAPEVLYARPATAFAARFVGTPPMNVLGCADRRVLVGVRPEEVRLAAADEPGAVPAVVQTVEYLGADSILTCVLGTQSIAARVAGRIALAPGTTVSLAWPRSAVHLFDAETGRRLDEIADIPSIAS
jgi:sn-glycerol 3-phosphate transport system ATP-binding protein